MIYTFCNIPGYRRGRVILGSFAEVVDRSLNTVTFESSREVGGRHPRVSFRTGSSPYNLVIVRRENDTVGAYAVYEIRSTYPIDTGETIYDLSLDGLFTVVLTQSLRSSLEIDTTRYTAPDDEGVRNVQPEPIPETAKSYSAVTSGGIFQPTVRRDYRETSNNGVVVVITATADPLTGEPFRNPATTPGTVPAVYTSSGDAGITNIQGDPQSYILEIEAQRTGESIKDVWQATPYNLTHWANSIDKRAGAFDKIVKIQLVPKSWLNIPTGDTERVLIGDKQIEDLPDKESGKYYYWSYRHVRPSSRVVPAQAFASCYQNVGDVAKAVYFGHSFTVVNNGIPVLKIPAEEGHFDPVHKRLDLNELKVCYTVNGGLNFYLKWRNDDNLSASISVPDLLAVLDNKAEWWRSNGESVGGAAISAVASAVTLAIGAATGGVGAAAVGGVGLVSSLAGQGLSLKSSYAAATRSQSKTAGTNTAGQNATGSGRYLLECLYDYDRPSGSMTPEEFYRRYGYACIRHFDGLPEADPKRPEYYYIEGAARLNLDVSAVYGNLPASNDDIEDAINEELSQGATVYPYRNGMPKLGTYPVNE